MTGKDKFFDCHPILCGVFVIAGLILIFSFWDKVIRRIKVCQKVKSLKNLQIVQ